jgi:signal peptidase I
MNIRSALKAIAGGVLLLVFIRYGIFFAFAPRPYAAVKGYIVPNSSMSPSIKKGDRIFVLKYVEAGIQPQRLDVVAFEAANEPTRISRIIGLPGETVQIRDGKVLINEKLLEIDMKYFYLGPYGWNVQLQSNSYFLLGDNGGPDASGAIHSKDSRFLGPIPTQELIGVVKKIYWPLSRVGEPSNHSFDRPAAGQPLR